MAVTATSATSDQPSDPFLKWKDGTGASGVRAKPRPNAPRPSGTESTSEVLFLDGIDQLAETETNDADLIWATTGTVTELSPEIVTVESSDGMTLDLPMSVFVEQPAYGSPVRYEVRRRSNGTRYQEARVLPDSGSPQAMAELEEILARF
jgi:hypothetical protein